ncbi:trypsin-like serine protease, partial [Salmonella enterica subsp. enterica serovar Enteritidis]|nr:trypsin-like serine protease [Salmonella enterica subsp. enterica serovar Enteritidis]
FGDSSKIEAGQTVLAIGSPLGSQCATSVTQGIVSAKSCTVDVTDSSGNTTGQATVIQTDAAINSGNSGGPLINLS